MTEPKNESELLVELAVKVRDLYVVVEKIVANQARISAHLRQITEEQIRTDPRRNPRLYR